MDASQTTMKEGALASGARLDVPFFGQYATDVPQEWQKRICGIASLRMALGYVLRGAELPGIAALIAESEAIKGWTPYGLAHDAVVRLAHNHGVAAYREEFRSVQVNTSSNSFEESPHAADLAAYGKGKLRDALVKGIIPIVSITVDGRKDTHLVPLIGFSNEGWFYHDPEGSDADPGTARFVSNETFDAHFRNLVIFIGPAA